jgi:aminopeptidase N
MPILKRRLTAFGGVLLTAAALAIASGTDAAARDAQPDSQRGAQPGAPGVGDGLFPHLGNGGYDAHSYDLNLRYETSAPAQPVSGRVKMNAQANQDLSSFNLDFGGDTVRSVRVNGQPAKFDWQQAQEELVITPANPIRRGLGFCVEVAFTASPVVPAPDDIFPVGWVATPRGSFTSAQPDTAHRIYPVNDHPSDKAKYRFTLDVPDGVTAVANGTSTGKRTANGRTVWTYDQRQPMASELVQLAEGTDLSIVHRGGASGVTYRDVISNDRRDLIEPAFARGPALLDWTVGKVGAFPAGLYGNLGVNQLFGYSLETQSLALHSYGLFDPTFVPGRTGEPWFYSPVMVHEIAHEWYGDSVSPKRWSDVWLNEGWATWLMEVYEAETGTIDDWGFPSFEAYMQDQYAQGDAMRAQFGPIARPSSAANLFSPQVYDGAALALYALQQEIGEAKFRQIQREWPRQFADKAVSTNDFIAFASRVAGRNLTGFLGDWLYGEHTPDMPGHPDWTVDPATTAAATTARTHTPSAHPWSHGAPALPAAVGTK